MGASAPSLPPGELFGALAEFATPAELYHACEGVRDAGYTRWDAHTPFPVHGLDRAMGLKASLLPWVVLVMALGGAADRHGPPGLGEHHRLPAGDQRQALLQLAGLHARHLRAAACSAAPSAPCSACSPSTSCRRSITRSSPPPRFERASDDGFFISIESWDPRFDADRTVDLLRRLGAKEVELVASSSKPATTRATP